MSVVSIIHEEFGHGDALREVDPEIPERGSKTSTVPVVWATIGTFFFAVAIQMISCCDWWPWTKPCCITITRRQSKNQWSGGIAAQPAPNLPSAKIPWKISRLEILRSRRHPPDWLPSKEPKYYLISAGAIGGHFKGETPWEFHQCELILARKFPVSPGTFNPEETNLPGLPISWSPTLISGSGPARLPPVPWTENTIEWSPFLVQRGGHCYRETWLFRQISVFFEWLAKFRPKG